MGRCRPVTGAAPRRAATEQVVPLTEAEAARLEAERDEQITRSWDDGPGFGRRRRFRGGGRGWGGGRGRGRGRGWGRGQGGGWGR